MAKTTAIQILKDAALLKEAKSKDYQGGQFDEESYFPFGYESYMTMILTKITRIRSVAEREDKSDINFESMEDSLLDLINYASMMCAWVENNRMKENEDTLT